MRVALVHEFLTQVGGAERVLECFHELFPEAPVFTLIYNKKKTEGRYDSYKIKTSFLQKLPQRYYKWYLAMMPKAIESFNFKDFDIVISDSSAFAKGVITVKPTRHISYCHTPTRYLWENMEEYVSSLPYSRFIKWSLRPYLTYYLEGWDFAAAGRPDYLIANSKTVQARIKKYYGRDSEVIYPPVDTEFFQPSPPAPLPLVGEGGRRPGEGYYFTASRLEPYKNIDLVVEAFAKLGLPLKIAGSGTQILNLKSSAKGGSASGGKNIEFLGRVSDEELRQLYCGARAFVFPALEDAGIVVLEALSCGTPVIGLNKGGTPEFIKDGENGVLFENQSLADIIEAVKRFKSMKFDARKLRESALPFDKETFKEKIRTFVNAHWH